MKYKDHWKNKYPNIFYCDSISLEYLCQHLEIYNNFKNDTQNLKDLGLQDFGKDFKKICDFNWLITERKEKLDQIEKKIKINENEQ